jgi:hypothetical protein
MSLRSNWLPPPLSRKRVCPPPLEPKGGQHSHAGEEAGGANSNDWRESLALCILCAVGQRGQFILFSVVFTPPPLLPVISLLLANTGSRGCWLAYPYDSRGFVGTKKKTSLGLLELQ